MYSGLDLPILETLTLAPRHGYGIAQHIQQVPKPVSAEASTCERGRPGGRSLSTIANQKSICALIFM
jgi:hypothetical protein